MPEGSVGRSPSQLRQTTRVNRQQTKRHECLVARYHSSSLIKACVNVRGDFRVSVGGDSVFLLSGERHFCDRQPLGGTP